MSNAAEVEPTRPTEQATAHKRSYSSTLGIPEAQEVASAGSRRRSRTKSMYLDLRSATKDYEDYQNQLESSEINVGLFENRFEQAALEEDADRSSQF